MKFKKTTLLPLILIAPLFMANSPAPQVKTTEYKDFTCEYVSKTKTTDYCAYNFSVTNTGSGYIKNGHVSCDEFDVTFYFNGDVDDSVPFRTTVIAPGETQTLSAHLLPDVDTITNPKYKCYAYQEFVDNAFSSDKKDITMQYVDGYYVYTLSFDSDVKRESKYEYGIITELTYQGNKYVMHHELGYNSYIFCSSKEELDLSQLTIDKLIMTRSDAYVSGFGYVLLAIVIILFVGLALIVSGGIFVIIFFTVRAVRKRRALNNAQ